MQTYHTTHRVAHSADDMFKLVAAVEDYPMFLPLCDALTVRSREQQGTNEVLVADMTVAYKFFHETFTSRVTLNPDSHEVVVEHIDGPFKHLENRWRFHAQGDGESEVDFYIAYEFGSRAMQMMMGAVFDKAFRKFVGAFEERADQVYGVHAA
ncbi:MAG: type II toxin-antitoxin system RatA family toxin [Hyphomicrobiales bacterium]|nr:type II toxin-antitoxin system RatA family toxin [Hyphomicrobiales bacterium]